MPVKHVTSVRNILFSEVYNDFEKLAIVKTLLMICTTDEEFHAGEQTFIKEMVKLLNMSRRQFEQVNTITEERTMDLLRRMDDAKKEFLFGLMKSAVLADGAVHAHEIEMLKDICHKAEIPTGR